MSEADQLKVRLAALTPRERAEIARFLLESLEGGEDADWETAWETELKRRSAEIDAGTAVGRPAVEVFEELRRKYS